MNFEEILDALGELFPASDIEQPFDLAPAVYQAYSDGRIPALTIRLRSTQEKPRKYLGASSIGGECPRKTWAQWRGLGTFPGRIRRLFKTGDVYEERMAAELRAIGFEVGGDQSRFEAFDGRVAGHTDRFARVGGIPWILTEMKTANRRNANRIKKLVREEGPDEGLRQWKPKYHGQIHCYMTAFDVPACLYLVTCKDRDELINFLVPRDDSVTEEMGERARVILEADGLPPRGYERPQTPECTRFCDHSDWCWYEGDMPRACGACIHWRDGVCDLTGEDAITPCDRFEAVQKTDEEKADPWAEELM